MKPTCVSAAVLLYCKFNQKIINTDDKSNKTEVQTEDRDYIYRSVAADEPVLF